MVGRWHRQAGRYLHKLAEAKPASGRLVHNGMVLRMAGGGIDVARPVLAAAIACEVAGTVFMKLSNSLTRWVWIPPMLFAYILALLGLALALRTIEVGIAYAVWAATGTLLIALVGVVFFGESLSLIKVVAIILVIAGVVGLHKGARGGAFILKGDPDLVTRSIRDEEVGA